ncbi:hypothetical protein VFC49_09285 [Thermococcus sp. SY098]|uniref:hypothetical protein n=1 Tax=Thermococcus sp. SY098 TaxID=3111325 RepID=UPI002D7759C5|nr:hypothetical protein [Thermococcus sp. SY098]WRS52239.1 hypothetical protein VFC49_09285 [Thermococcus sp. SY098]
MTWLIFERDDKWIDVVNVEQITAIQAKITEDGEIIAIIYQPDGEIKHVLKDKKQLETLINVLEAEAGWFYIKDGKIMLWKGVFKESKKEGEENASSH